LHGTTLTTAPPAPNHAWDNTKSSGHFGRMAQVNAIQIWFVEPLVVLRHFKRFHILPSDMLPGIAFFLSWSCKKKTYMLFGGWS